jgi:hypothetical protein
VQEQSLVDMLADTFRRVEARAEAHSHALAYAAARQTVGYLLERVQRLQREISALSGATALLGADDRVHNGDHPWRDNMWHRTASDLLREEPRQVRAPAAAITSADQDLYELISYVGAAIALVRERRRQALAVMIERPRRLATGQTAGSCGATQFPALNPIDHQRIADLLALADDEADGSGTAVRAVLTSLGMQTQIPARDDSSCEAPVG